MPSPEHDKNFSHPEEKRGAVHNPKVSTLLGSAGLTAVDFQLFDRLYQQGQTVFVHGSIIAERMTPTSDIDFTIIGNRTEMSPELQETLMPGLDAVERLHNTIDYTSSFIRSQAGRRISMHLSEPDFRETYPTLDKPYATEYRPGIYAKESPRLYFLAGIGRNGHIRLINFSCESTTIGDNGSTVTDIPQTGRFLLKDHTIYMDGKEKTNITTDKVIRLKPDGDPDIVPADEAEETMILGLEFDKMLSDTSMYNDQTAEERFVKGPLIRSMEALGEFARTDPAVVTSRVLSELAKHWSKVKPYKPR